MPEKGRPAKEWHGASGGGAGVVLQVSQAREKIVGAASEGIHSHLEVRTQGLRLDPGAPEAAPDAAEVIVIDCSDSMREPSSKIEAAREAATRAVVTLRHGTRFAVVQGTHRPTMVHPRDEGLVRADPDTVARATDRIRRLYAEGGTAIGTWLAQVRRLLADCPAEIRHAMLLTDGRNEHHPEQLPAELDACEGLFTCDAWGIGHDYDRRELMMIADRLHGSADIVVDEADLAAKFEETMRASMARSIATLPIRITLTLPGTRLRYLKQTYPRERDLTGDGRPVDKGLRVVEFPTQAWAGDELREYHLCLDADPTGQAHGEDLRLAMAEVITPPGMGPAPEAVPLVVRWLPGRRPSTEHVSRASLHRSLYMRLGEAVAKGCDAYEGGEPAAAEAAFRRATELAQGLGDEGMLDMLAGFMDLDPPGKDGPRLKEDFDPRLLDRIWLRRRHTTPHTEPGTGPATGADTAATGSLRTCPVCEELSPSDARYCYGCRREFAA
ncbi:VWA domain-containing protein [Streptomyces sp. 6N223]|uniref:VWA domain-containing protein n=1 Tax=Streptomyces sp. 6N223 TaxID=3457412 RepID=UPI003FD67322